MVDPIEMGSTHETEAKLEAIEEALKVMETDECPPSPQMEDKCIHPFTGHCQCQLCWVRYLKKLLTGGA
jgi:hypothetical protein